MSDTLHEEIPFLVFSFDNGGSEHSLCNFHFFARMLPAAGQLYFGRGQLYRGIYIWGNRGVFWLEEKFEFLKLNLL